MSTPVVLIPGDGIGPEVTRAMQAVLEAFGRHQLVGDVLNDLGCINSHAYMPVRNGLVERINGNQVMMKKKFLIRL